MSVNHQNSLSILLTEPQATKCDPRAACAKHRISVNQSGTMPNDCKNIRSIFKLNSRHENNVKKILWNSSKPKNNNAFASIFSSFCSVPVACFIYEFIIADESIINIYILSSDSHLQRRRQKNNFCQFRSDVVNNRMLYRERGVKKWSNLQQWKWSAWVIEIKAIQSERKIK